MSVPGVTPLIAKLQLGCWDESGHVVVEIVAFAFPVVSVAVKELTLELPTRESVPVTFPDTGTFWLPLNWSLPAPGTVVTVVAVVVSG